MSLSKLTRLRQPNELLLPPVAKPEVSRIIKQTDSNLQGSNILLAAPGCVTGGLLSKLIKEDHFLKHHKDV